MAGISILDVEGQKKWDHFVWLHPLGSIYHISNWQKVIKNAYGLRSYCVCIMNENNNIVSGIPIFWVGNKIINSKLSSVPGAQYCNPLVDNLNDYQKIVSFLKEEISKFKCNKWFIEIKTSSNFKFKIDNMEEGTSEFLTHQLDLKKSIDTIWKNLHNSCIKRVIKKANKSNFIVEKAKNEKDVKKFYCLYLSMRKEKGLLPQPLKYFTAMWRNLFPNHQMSIFLCKKNNMVIGTILLLYYKELVVYEYGATKRDMKNQGVSQILLWEAIKDAHEKGFKRFDFGRTSDENTGLKTYKSRWGTEINKLTYYYFPKNNKHGFKIKDKLQTIMKLIVKNTPCIISRMIGRMIYRYLV